MEPTRSRTSDDLTGEGGRRRGAAARLSPAVKFVLIVGVMSFFADLLFLLSAIFMNVFVIPWGLGHATSLGGGLLGILALVGKLVVCGLLIVIIDSSFAKLRFLRIAEYLGAACLLALIGIATSYVLGT
jgi:formate hydrogenlyase subunit 4